LLLIALLVGALLYQTMALANARTEHATYVAKIDKAAKDATDAARAEEQRRQREIDQIRNDAQHQIKAAADDVGSCRQRWRALARDVLGWLRRGREGIRAGSNNVYAGE
jgi:hypothetical protein